MWVHQVGKVFMKKSFGIKNITLVRCILYARTFCLYANCNSRRADLVKSGFI
jgi:hypothetical protein